MRWENDTLIGANHFFLQKRRADDTKHDIVQIHFYETLKIRDLNICYAIVTCQFKESTPATVFYTFTVTKAFMPNPDHQ